MNIKAIKNEFVFATSRSSGKGGQHVNKTESKVEIAFHIDNSLGLTEDEKKLLNQKYATRIKSGRLLLFVQAHRSQIKNKELAIKKMLSLISRGLRVQKSRVKTKPPKEVNEKRLANKKRRQDIKESRKKIS